MVAKVKSNRRRVKRGRKKGNKLATRKYVARAVRSKQERKKFRVLIQETIMNGNAMRIFNPTYQIAPGTDSNTRIGRTVSDVYLKLSIAYTHIGNNSLGVANSPSSVLRCLVLSSRAVKTAGYVAPDTLQTVGACPGMEPLNVFWETDRLGIAPVQKSRWTVLRDFTLESHRVSDLTFTNGSGNTVYRKNMIIPIHKKCNFRDPGGNVNAYLTENEVYVCFVASARGLGNTDQCGWLLTSGELSFTDS